MSVIPDFDGYFNRYILLKQYYMSGYAPYIDVDDFRVAELGEPGDITLPEIKNEIMFAIHAGQLYVRHNMNDIELVERYKLIIDTYKYNIANNTLYYHISINNTGVYLICYISSYTYSSNNGCLSIHNKLINQYTIEIYTKILKVCRQITEYYDIKRFIDYTYRNIRHIEAYTALLQLHVKVNSNISKCQNPEICHIHKSNIPELYKKLEKTSNSYPEVPFVDTRISPPYTLESLAAEVAELRNENKILLIAARSILKTDNIAQSHMSDLIEKEEQKKKDIQTKIDSLNITIENMRQMSMPNLQHIIKPMNESMDTMRKDIADCDTRITHYRSFFT